MIRVVNYLKHDPYIWSRLMSIFITEVKEGGVKPADVFQLPKRVNVKHPNWPSSICEMGSLTNSQSLLPLNSKETSKMMI